MCVLWPVHRGVLTTLFFYTYTIRHTHTYIRTGLFQLPHEVDPSPVAKLVKKHLDVEEAWWR